VHYVISAVWAAALNILGNDLLFLGEKINKYKANDY
jgi:hypothetical protein